MPGSGDDADDTGGEAVLALGKKEEDAQMDVDVEDGTV